MKVFDEIKAFERKGFEMEHINFPPISSGLRAFRLGKGVCASIPFSYVFSRFEYSSALDGFDFYYFRFEAADYRMTRFLRLLRRHNPLAKIIIEFPDFPNTAWLRSPLYFAILLKDYVARRKYKRYVDRFVVYDPQYKEVYGVPTLRYKNGIDISRVRTRKPRGDNRSIEAIGVGTMTPVHGYERFIQAMSEYYRGGGTREIVFHIVGDGPGEELGRYKSVTQKTGMADHVVFEGRLEGEDLAKCYDECNLAVEQLAMYRRENIQISSSLKSREYVAEGLPIVSGCNIDIFEGEDYKYWLRFENDDTPIDMKRIIDFCDKIYEEEDEQDVIRNIREFAQDHCVWDITLHEVFDYLHDNRG